MNIDLNKNYAVSIGDMLLIILLSIVAGAIIAAVTPAIIYTIIAGFVIYIVFNIYTRLKTHGLTTK